MTEWAEIARTRQGLYRFFGEALLPPSGNQLELLAGAAVVLGDRGLDRFAFSSGFRRFARHFAADQELEGIEVEYVRLFASGMSSALSPPTESYYRVASKGGAVAEFVAELQREYRAMGVATVGLDESPDHVTTELRVVAHLCDLEAGAWESGQAVLAGEVIGMESRFLRRHLALWFPAFRDRVSKAGPSEFYRDLVEAVHGFVVHDHDFLHAIQTEVSA